MYIGVIFRTFKIPGKTTANICAYTTYVYTYVVCIYCKSALGAEERDTYSAFIVISP